MPVERDVQFLNIDMLLVGRFDRTPLLTAARDRLFVLHADKNLVALELAGQAPDLSRTLARLLNWVQGLPPAARRSWRAASRRVFDIGIHAGLGPHESHWCIRQEQVAALAKVGGEVVLTVYGAKWRGRAPERPASRRASRALARKQVGRRRA